MKKLKKIISRLNKAKVLVVGDLILDQHIWGDVERISPEAPVPVVWAKRRTYAPGGAANVAHNISAFGSQVTLCGVLGDAEDPATQTFQCAAKKLKINTAGVFFEPDRMTTLKTRIIAGHQQMVRVDWEDVHSIGKPIKDKITKYLDNHIKKIADELHLVFDTSEYLALDPFYFASDNVLDLTSIDDITDQAKIAGTPVGLVGTIIINDYDGRLVLSNLKKYVGYQISQSNTPLTIALTPRQVSLF